MLRFGRVSWQAVMCTLSCDCLWLFFHTLKDKLDAWTSLPAVFSTGNQLLSLSAGHSATKASSLVTNGGKDLSLLLEKFLSLQRYKDKFWNQGVLMKLFRIWFKTHSESDFWSLTRLWTNTTMEVFLQNSLRTWALGILSPSFWCLLIWIFDSYHVPSLKAEHCNSQ